VRPPEAGPARCPGPGRRHQHRRSEAGALRASPLSRGPEEAFPSRRSGPARKRRPTRRR